MKFKLLIPIFTFVTGIVIFSIIALSTNSFWFHSSCDVPILKSPSLYIGDSIFIPLFNYFLFELYQKTKAEINYIKYKQSFRIYLAVAILISFSISYTQHIAWTKDQFTGFIDLEFNKLSFGGWYHLIFAGAEMTIMLLLIWVFGVIIAEKNEDGFMASKKLFWIFFFYSSCSVLDLYVKLIYVVKENDLVRGVREYLTDLKVFFSGCLLLIAYYLIKVKIYDKWVMKKVI